MPKNAFYDLTLIKMIVVRFVGTGSLLIRYSNGHVCLFVCFCLFSWRYNPFGCIFHSPVAGFSLLILEVS